MTEMKKLSIHRALTELKMLNLRIETATNEVSAVVANRKSNRKMNGVDIQEYEKQMQASYDKVVGLISYRNKIKALVVQSNASTKVIVGKEEMTVAEAIERKQSIQYEKNLLEIMQHQYRSTINTVAKENDALPAKLETYLINILGNKDKQSPDEVKLHTETFMKRNEYEIIDPLNVKKQIESLSTRIEEFESEVDAVLSESNATTFIEVEA
ncbi:MULTISPECIES: hypothetical protein [Lysinibacillus]|jgi:hypothetical protein|uniref:hypothetical protein n=1 Tax=Lysinibacillus TaxID=400634 RepID=UPI00055C4FDD|nr:MULTISPECIES: hypothetical protein [Lysinibacillus]MEE3809261.1 hypothetical protein [Lysinibacillus fusiformis]WCH47221.1 hypothetical protein NV349_19715 [Lysinibacillus sp. OF-1]SCZ04481.1 hypothetical protein SAMN02787078_03811 [Lysinibacillus sp. SG9]SDB50745.1 hypothetical protein SAMN02787079_03937 [Lysinibacillus sp. TC-37]SFT14625.1 hypothetical protein SAMN02787087_03930 [Lysinibacillus sp. SG55]